MEDYQVRVIDEHAALEESTEKLQAFMASEAYDKVSVEEKSYLEAQLPLMQQLLNILHSRAAMYAQAKDVKTKPASKVETQAKIEKKEEAKQPAHK